MQQILILVEGQTEEQFVKNALQPYLIPFGINVIPTIINTKIVKGSNNFKGGINSYGQVERDLSKLLKDASVYVTTLIDFYGLPHDFPGYSEKNSSGSSTQFIETLETEWSKRVNNNRFIPYIQQHEFEALLFSSGNGFNEFYSHEPKIIEQIGEIRNSFNNPEDINDNPLTAPSKRLINIIPNYDKILNGTLISLSNGIQTILDTCPRFNSWIENLKTFSAEK